MAKKTIPTTAALAAELAALAPDGWAATTGEGHLDADGDVWALEPGATFVRFERADGDLRAAILLNVEATTPKPGSWADERTYRGRAVEGHTTFNGRTFTRRGIDVSSCVLRDSTADGYEHEYADVPALLAGEFERCRAAHDRGKTMVAVPGLPGGFRVTPESKATIGAALRDGKTYAFTPSGFGTGYQVARGRYTLGRWSKQLPGETSTFFGVDGLLYYASIDCD